MKTTPEALKALYQTLGGSSGNVAGESKTTGILNKIAALFGSTATADKIPDAIDNINAVASGVTKPDGKITITENATDINVAQYATADVNVSGGGGSSDFSTAKVAIIDPDECLERFVGPCVENNKSRGYFNGDPSEGIPVILYKGMAEVGVQIADATVETSGSVTTEAGAYIVTGDCTFTITAN